MTQDDKKVHDIRNFQNILLPRFDAFGDIVLLQGFIQALLNFLPEARITLLVREGYDQLATLFPDRLLWKTAGIHLHEKPSELQEIKSLLKEMKKESYDLLLTTTYNRIWLDDVLAASLTQTLRIAIGQDQGMNDYAAEILAELEITPPQDLYQEYIAVEERSHETNKYQKLWEWMTGRTDPLPKPKLFVPKHIYEKADEFLSGAGWARGAYAFCFPAGVSNVALKAWPEENFAEVIAELEKKYALRTIVAAHESEKGIVDKVTDAAICHGADPLIWLGKDGDIPLACALVGQSAFYLGNDTGMMHMAAALEKPVVAIFGGGHWPRFLPVVDIGAVFTQELDCFYCLWHRCWLEDAPCVRWVSVVHVNETIERVIHGEVAGLEVHKGISLDEPCLHRLLENGKIQFNSLFQERNLAVAEIQKRDAWLTEMRQDRDHAVAEIHKRDAWMAELRSVNQSLSRMVPLVSVVTPVYNAELWIERCIQSVREQDYPKIEHIIVDGGSTDRTLDVCRKYPHLVIHSRKDRGQSHAINKGFSMAQGEILAWLCADDEYEPGAIRAAVKGIIAGNDVVMGYSRFVDAGGNYLAEHPSNVHPYYDHDMLLRFWKYGTISQPATLWTRKAWERYGPLRENLQFAMDYDLWLRMSKKTVFSHIDAYVAKYCIHPNAKCFSDNYGSRIELIKVSKAYWPPKWTYGYWQLSVQYILSHGGNTTHYADAEGLLHSAEKNLADNKRIKAIGCFVLAHIRHPAAPLMPGYMITLKKIVAQGIGPRWFWSFSRKSFYRLTLRKSIHLSATRSATGSEVALVLKAEITGYKNVKFRYWAKNGTEILSLTDWVTDNSITIRNDIDKYKEYGVHIKRDTDKDFIAQTWIRAPQDY